MPKKTKGPERMRDAISYRVTDRQRAFLEKFAAEQKVGICEAARELLDLGIKAKAGAEI
jgi:hypothetical protein